MLWRKCYITSHVRLFRNKCHLTKRTFSLEYIRWTKYSSNHLFQLKCYSWSWNQIFYRRIIISFARQKNNIFWYFIWKCNISYNMLLFTQAVATSDKAVTWNSNTSTATLWNGSSLKSDYCVVISFLADTHSFVALSPHASAFKSSSRAAESKAKCDALAVMESAAQSRWLKEWISLSEIAAGCISARLHIVHLRAVSQLVELSRLIQMTLRLMTVKRSQLILL